MPKEIRSKDRRSKIISIRVAEEEYAALRAFSWLTNRTPSTALYDWLKPYFAKLLERPDIQQAMRLGKSFVVPQEKPLSNDEEELRDLALWLKEDRLAR